MENIIDINLLPHRKRRKQLSKENRRIITIGVVFLIVMGLLYGGLRFQLYKRTSYLEDLNTQIAQLKSVENLLNKRQTLGDELYYYESTIENLVNSQIVWNKLIDDLEEVLPKVAVLDSLAVDKEKKIVTISGRTTDVQKLSWTFSSLKTKFDKVVLTKYTIPFEKPKTPQTPQYVTFTFTFQWKEMGK